MAGTVLPTPELLVPTYGCWAAALCSFVSPLSGFLYIFGLQPLRGWLGGLPGRLRVVLRGLGLWCLWYRRWLDLGCGYAGPHNLPRL